jgi:hypothetical protein
MNDRNQSDINSILQNGYSVKIGNFISRGWEILQGNLGGFILFTFVTFLIAVAAVIVALICFITIIGIPLGILIIFIFPLAMSPLAAGHLIVAFKVIKNQSFEFGDFFKGFKNTYFMPIFLSALILGIFTAICGAPGQILSYINQFAMMSSPEAQPNIGLTLVSFILSMIGALAGALIMLFYSLTVPFIIDRKMTFWPAMEASRQVVTKQWPMWILLGIVISLINFATILTCGIGLLITSPFSVCIIAAAYEHIMGVTNSTDDSFI